MTILLINEPVTKGPHRTVRVVSHTVRGRVLETSLWKLSTGFEPSFLLDIGNRLAGLKGLSFQRCAPQARKNFRNPLSPVSHCAWSVSHRHSRGALVRRTPERPAHPRATHSLGPSIGPWANQTFSDAHHICGRPSLPIGALSTGHQQQPPFIVTVVAL